MYKKYIYFTIYLVILNANLTFTGLLSFIDRFVMVFKHFFYVGLQQTLTIVFHVCLDYDIRGVIFSLQKRFIIFFLNKRTVRFDCENCTYIIVRLAVQGADFPEYFYKNKLKNSIKMCGTEWELRHSKAQNDIWQSKWFSNLLKNGKSFSAVNRFE